MKERRGMPGFLIIGAQRCGTTSLYDDLVKHPSIATASQKEIHFFDLNFQKGIDWYQAQFPGLGQKGFITGEASPYYIFHPLAPKRILAAAPEIKLIVMLRNPVNRAYSHYQHEIKIGAEA